MMSPMRIRQVAAQPKTERSEALWKMDEEERSQYYQLVQNQVAEARKAWWEMLEPEDHPDQIHSDRVAIDHDPDLQRAMDWAQGESWEEKIEFLLQSEVIVAHWIEFKINPPLKLEEIEDGGEWFGYANYDS